MRTRGRMCTAALAVLVLAACDTGADQAADTLADTGMATVDTATGVTADGWSDAQIFGLMARLNGNRMAAAELGKSRVTNAEVQQLLETIDREHTQMQQRLNDLAQQMNVTPVAPEDSAMLEEHNEDLRELQERNAGIEWDREFVDEMEDWQEDTREMLTRAIESTRSAELRQALMDMRSTIEQHLRQTTQVKERIE